MKKRLLFAFVAMCVAVSGFALTKNEFVNTPQGRFQIIGDNLNANNAFQTMDGWTAIGEGKTLADLFNTNADGLSAGFNSVVSTAATAGEGMYFKFVPTDANVAYVVSFKMKGAALSTIRLNTIGYNGKNESLGDVLTNGVKVEGNSDHVYGGTNDVLTCNTAEELTEAWQTFNYAIKGDGVARTYFISFTHMATDVEIADLQIAPAMQFADLRQRDAMVAKMEAYKNCYSWSEDVLADVGYTENLEALKAIGDESGQEALDEQLATCQEILDEFLKANMDDYLAGGTTTSGGNDNYLGIKTSSGNTQKVSNYGDWTATTTGRAFWSNGDYPDLGHYQKGSKWNYNDVTSAMGVYMQKTLDPGAYVFAIEGKAGMREDATQTWYLNEGLKPAYGVAYIVNVVDGEVTDTIASVVQDLDPVTFTPFILPITIKKEGTVEIGFKAYCKEAYQELICGSVTYVKDASLWGKNGNKYNQKQLGYEADVLEQIKAGRDNIEKAVEYLDDPAYFWGKTDLEAVVNEVEPKIEVYEALSQDDIIATFEEDYAKSTSEETGYLVYTIYQEAVKDIIAANKFFVAINDTLNSIQKVIDNAEATMAMRLYSAAAGKADLQAAIDAAKALQTQMKAAQYSEENAATIVAANATLNEAIDAFKASIPASAIATLVDIDFENDAVLNEATGLYGITGAAGTMEFSNFASDANDSYPFQQGFWSNGEQQWKGYLRVGNGTGTVTFDPTVNGSMGNSILKLNCDFFLQGLTGKFVGFYLKNETDSVVAGFFANYYDSKIDATSNLPIDMNNLKYGSGSSYNNVAPEGAEGAGTTVCAKNSFEVILDFGEGTIYCTTTSAKGTVSTAKQAFDKSVPVSFILQSNYINNDRRVWFDNLKIQRIATGEVAPEVDPDELIVNGNCEGEDAGCLVVKNGDGGGAYTWNAVDGVGIDGSKAAVVHATSTAVDEWDAQFFIYAKNHVFELGEKFKLTFWVKADKEAQADLQAHTTPGNYCGWNIDGFNGPLQITTEWKEVVIEGTISDAMSQYGAVMSGMQTVAFNLNKDKTLENNYYFDNISWKLVSDDTAVKTLKTVDTQSDAIFNLAGQKVDANYKGVVIINGKKVLMK